VVNAFALPDGRIYVTLGLMRLIQNDPDREDELAFVVGHEVTHVVEHHSAQQAKKSLPLYLGAAILGAATRSEVVGAGGALLAQAGAAHYSREDEYAADKGGLLAMKDAGYDPHGAVDMLRRLQDHGKEQNSTVNGWFGSHPLTQNRVERIRKMTRDLSNGRNIRDRSGRDYDRQQDRDNRNPDDSGDRNQDQDRR
jgi:predicted Zn-dependent protease